MLRAFQIRELVTSYEAAKKEIHDSKSALDEALKDLDFTRSENMTLAEKIKVLQDRTQGREMTTRTKRHRRKSFLRCLHHRKR